MKKIGKFLSSMGFAVALLVILAAACALSSLVEQGLTQETYAARYGEGIASVIMALQVNDAYHSVWFIVLSGFLCLNLILCNLIRFPAFVKRWRKEKDPEAVNTAGDLGDTETGSPEQVLSAMRMPDVKRCRTAEGREALFSNRNAIGQWGAWICHLGVLLLIAGFALGQMTGGRECSPVCYGDYRDRSGNRKIGTGVCQRQSSRGRRRVSPVSE